MTPEQAKALRAEFPPEAIGKLPRAGIQLDYVGHAAVTDRLLQVDPAWTWEPLALAVNGTPFWEINGNDAVMWIRLTVCGVSRLGVGIVPVKAFELEKQLISDAIRNAAMRFGVALSLWSKEDLSGAEQSGGRGPEVDKPSPGRAIPDTPDRYAVDGPDPTQTVAKHRRESAKSRAVALQADKVPVADARMARNLPPIDKANADEMLLWEELLSELESELSAPFEAAQS